MAPDRETPSSRIPLFPGAPSDRLFLASVMVLLVLVSGVLVVFFMDGPRGGPSSAGPPPLSPPEAPASSVDATPDVPFVDCTELSGVDFIHRNGATGEKLLPETMGSGVAVIDFDGDGDQDLLFANGTDWPWSRATDTAGATPQIYQNLGQGMFTNVTANSGLGTSLQGTGIAVGDYDNDGWTDVFLTGVGKCRLLHNRGGRGFEEVTEAAGISQDAEEWSTSAAFMDFDNDGDLDLFICQYVRWSRDIDITVDYRLAGVGRAYGPPDSFPASHPRLYQNLGNGRFRDVSAQSGVQVMNRALGGPMAKSLGVSPVDLDRDGWMDLVVANDTVQNFVFHNLRNGKFQDIGTASGMAFDSYGTARGAMGIDSARMQEDDQLAIAIGNFANEMTALYVAQQNPLLFSDEAIAQGIGRASRLFLTFGVFFFDFDLDGWLDFLTANGHIEQEISRIQKSQQYQQSARLYWNARGSGSGAAFIPMEPSRTGPDLVKPVAGRGSAFGDLDGDGDLDVVITQVGGPPLILRNDQRLAHNWIRLKLAGRRCNRDAIGAWVTVQLPGRRLHRQVMPTRGYLSQSELPITIGLGRETAVAEVLVEWPGEPGKATKHSVTVNRTTRIVQP